MFRNKTECRRSVLLTCCINKPIRGRQWQINEKTNPMTKVTFFIMIDAVVFPAGSSPHQGAPELREGEHVDRPHLGNQLFLWTWQQLQLPQLTFNLWEKTFQLAWSHPPTRCWWRSLCCKRTRTLMSGGIEIFYKLKKSTILPWMEKLFFHTVIIPNTCLSCHHGFPCKTVIDVTHYVMWNIAACCCSPDLCWGPLQQAARSARTPSAASAGSPVDRNQSSGPKPKRQKRNIKIIIWDSN